MSGTLVPLLKQCQAHQGWGSAQRPKEWILVRPQPHGIGVMLNARAIVAVGGLMAQDTLPCPAPTALSASVHVHALLHTHTHNQQLGARAD